MDILDYEHQELIEEAQARRLAAERRHAVPGCPWGCDGSGWHEIALAEYGPLDAIPEVDPAVIVLPWGLLLFACECSSGAGGGGWGGRGHKMLYTEGK
jgi:hypothetical protein